jgi:hypothetical protein
MVGNLCADFRWMLQQRLRAGNDFTVISPVFRYTIVGL